MIKLEQQISCSGNTVNEDKIWHNNKTVAVLDGSTGLMPGRLDALWFTEQFLLRFNIENELPLSDAINASIAFTKEEFIKRSSAEEPEYFPSAAGIFVRESEETMDIIVIGDCTGLFFMRNGATITISDDNVRYKDKEAVDRCIEIRNKTGTTIAEALSTQEVRSMLLKNRKTMNKNGGYRILAPNMEACSKDDVIKLPKKDILRFALITDGFDAMKDQLGKSDASLEDLYQKLREAEDADPSLDLMPRLKKSDDASAVIAVIEPDND